MKMIEKFTQEARVVTRAEMTEELVKGLEGDELKAKLSELKKAGFLTEQVLDRWQELFR